MKLYLDLILIINFIYDFIILLGTGIILKRIINIKRITIGSFIGSLSILLLFYNLNILELLLYKIIISILMVLISFNTSNFKYYIYNFITFYFISFFLGGTLYALNNMFSYDHYGIIFVNNGYSINFIIILIISPIVIYLYIREQQLIKNKYNNYYDTKICIDDHLLNCKGYIDSGNNLKFKGKPVILIDKRKVIFLKENYRIIPYKVVNRILMLKIYKVDYIEISNKKINNIYLGISDDEFGIDGIDVLLNNKLLEEI